MHALVVCAVLAAASAGCLRGAEFRCFGDTDCGQGGVCESVGFCSVPNAACGTGRSFSDSAGQGLSNTCVPDENPGPSGPVRDAGVDAAIDAVTDAAIDAPVQVGCPSDYAPIAGSTHAYKALADVSWDEAVTQCRAAGAYLAVPDDATELTNLASVAAAPFWIGLDDQESEGVFETQTGVAPAFLPWSTGEPDNGPPAENCVHAVSAAEIATERCSAKRPAVCECQP